MIRILHAIVLAIALLLYPAAANAAPLQPIVVTTGFIANVAAARTTQIDLFNGSTQNLRILAIYIVIPSTAATGVTQSWEILRTSAVGTGGTAKTPLAMDFAGPPSGVSARAVPTGGATGTTTMLFLSGSSEETSVYAIMSSSLNQLPRGTTIAVAPGTGIKIDQTTNSAAGTTNFTIVFTME